MPSLADVTNTTPCSADSSLVRRSRILCCGDSLTAGYCGTPGGAFAPYCQRLGELLGVPADEIGMCGWKADHILANMQNRQCADPFGKQGRGLLAQMAKKPYTVCIIMVGTNDVGHGLSAETIMSNLRKLHLVCHKRGVRTVALPIPESFIAVQAQYREQDRQRRACNELLKAWAETIPERVKFVDMAPLVPFFPQSPNWAHDGLHMSASGYRRFAELLAPLIKEFVAVSATAAPRSGASSNRSSKTRHEGRSKSTSAVDRKAPYKPGTVVCYKRSSGGYVPAVVIGSSPNGAEYVVLEYDHNGSKVQNKRASLTSVCPFNGSLLKSTTRTASAREPAAAEFTGVADFKAVTITPQGFMAPGFFGSGFMPLSGGFMSNGLMA